MKEGSWVERHGKRVMFDDIVLGDLYVEDISTTTHEWYRVVRVLKKEDDTLFISDGKASAENGFMATTRKYVDADGEHEAGWMYELLEDDR